MKKLPLIIVLGALLALMPLFSYAATSGKSISDLKNMSEKQWLSMIQDGCTPVIHKGAEVGTICPTTSLDTKLTLDGKPSSVVGKNWTVMAPFSKPSSTSSPENLYIAKAEADSRYKPLFYVSNGALVFKANAGGVHSPNSKYPRTELREMVDEKWTNASWSNKTGTHTLEGNYSISSTLTKRNQIVFAQVHTSDDDLWEAAVDSNKLVIFYNDKKSVITLETNYRLGTKFSFKAVGHSNKFDVYYNGVLKGTIPKGGSGLYWKTGSYVQSNVKDWGESSDAFGQVTIYNLMVKH